MHSLLTHQTRRSWTRLIIFTILAVVGSYFTLNVLLFPQSPLLPFFYHAPWETGSGSAKKTYHNYTSAFSFDLDLATNPSWMARIPDPTPLSQLSIPGTHDTLTNNLTTIVGYQCQNHDLATQLRAGLRYFDIRGRLVYDPADSAEQSPPPPPTIAIYHAHVATGYDLYDVLRTVFEFLDAHPSEGVILRVKEEGVPLPVPSNDPAVVPIDYSWHTGVYNTTFEEAFNYYRHTNPLTAPGCAKHLLTPWPPSADSSSRMVPTMGELRGRALVLYEFETALPAADYGIPWTSPHIALEDLWVILTPAMLEDKWAAVLANLEAAAAAGEEEEDVLFLSHLSASVGVTPIEAAAGPLPDRTNGSVILGINERTGRWLEDGGVGRGAAGKTGVVMADFPGRRLVGDILKRNEWLMKGEEVMDGA